MRTAAAPATAHAAPTHTKHRANTTNPLKGPAAGYTKTPDAYLHLITGEKLSGALQRDLLYIIQRHTYGAGMEWARLSLAEFAKICTGSERASITRALADLAERNIIAVQTGEAKNAYQLNPEAWETAPPYRYVKPIPISAAAQEENPDTATPAAPVRHKRLICDKVVLKPRKKAAALPVQLEPPNRPPVEFRIAYENAGETSFEVSAVADADLLTFTFSGTPEKLNKAKPAPVVLKNNTKQSQHKQNTELNDLDAAIILIAAEEFGKTIDPASTPSDRLLCDRIAAAGADISPESFYYYALDQIHQMRRKRKKPEAGILIELAAQAAKLKKRSPAPSPPRHQPEADPAAVACLKALSERTGNSLEEFRALVQRPAADFSEWIEAQLKVYQEFGEAPPASLTDELMGVAS